LERDRCGARRRDAHVETLDLGLYRAGFASAHLVRWAGGCALVDVGSSRNLPALKAALHERGLSLRDLSTVFVTHIHLDHAGGAGALLAEPGCSAQLVVHKNGARHLAEPAALEQGARAVYGDAEFERTYGSLVPVPLDRMVVVRGGETISLAPGDCSLDARVIDTPGHARHHYCLHFAGLNAVFSGDTFGICYPEMNEPPPALIAEPSGGLPASHSAGVYVYPTTTPTAFDPEALKASVRTIAGLNAEVCYLTHYGPVRNPASHVDRICGRIDAMVADALSVAQTLQKPESAAENLSKRLEGTVRAELLSCRFSDDRVESICAALKFDFLLNSQGLLHWIFRYGPMSQS
jgi:glyoxylase-like metal-dependent hydrolase (beta-lactamase superfamily II)